VLEALQNVSSASDRSGTVLSDVADDATLSVSAEGSLKMATREVTIPGNVALPVELGSIAVLLPFSETRASSNRVAPGITSFNNHNGSTTAPIVKSDGSVQITTIIESADAPREYIYKLKLPEGAVAHRDSESGAVLVTVGEKLVLGIAPPWAFDAGGKEVPTSYQMRGSELVQFVDHSSGQHRYPIVADPWLGINLFQYGTVTTENGQPKVNLLPSGWGASMWASVSGHIIMNTAGWDEARSRWSQIRSALDSKATMRQQYECHVAGSPFAGGWWNLEKWRPSRTTHWSYGVAVHRCNWTTATQL